MSAPRVLAREVGRERIRVDCVRPGTTRTDIIVSLRGDGLGAQVAVATLLGCLGERDAVARAILWLSSDDVPFVHRALYDVSCGR
jgi:NAD(P)-dependent dehydrogenase (short-subunit alcohol dehydrogenase family)